MGPLSSVIQALLQDLTQGVQQSRADLTNQWSSIVGERLSQHTKPVLMSGGTVCVWVDDSTLAYELSQRFRGTILRRLEAVFGEGSVKRLIFRVGQVRR